MKHVNELRAISNTKPREYKELEEKYNSIYLHQSTYDVSLTAAGSLLNVVDSVMTDQVGPTVYPAQSLALRTCTLALTLTDIYMHLFCHLCRRFYRIKFMTI